MVAKKAVTKPTHREIPVHDVARVAVVDCLEHDADHVARLLLRVPLPASTLQFQDPTSTISDIQYSEGVDAYLFRLHFYTQLPAAL